MRPFEVLRLTPGEAAFRAPLLQRHEPSILRSFVETTTSTVPDGSG